MGDVYRDENEAALFAAARLREENEKLRRQVKDLELQVKAAEKTIGLARPPRRSRWTPAGIIGGAVGFVLLLAVGFVIGRARGPAAKPDSAPRVEHPAYGDAFNPMHLPNQPPVVGMPTSPGDGFDRGAAVAVLGKVAGNLSMCASHDGPTGTGRAWVTFAPDGTVSAVNLEGPPFAGTPSAECITQMFRQAHVPAFGGAPVRLLKIFSIPPGAVAP